MALGKKLNASEIENVTGGVRVKRQNAVTGVATSASAETLNSEIVSRTQSANQAASLANSAANAATANATSSLRLQSTRSASALNNNASALNCKASALNNNANSLDTQVENKY